jgi:hypothetical protein
MRTKTMLLTAACVAAGALSSMAQNVYSVNVVGYINVTAPPGYSLLGNQLTTTDTTIVGVLGSANAPATLQNCQVLTYVANPPGYTQDIYDVPSGGWVDYVTGTVSGRTLPAGSGFFFYNANTTNITLTLVGTVPQGTNTTALAPGYNMLSTVVPVAQALESTNGFPNVNSMLYLTYSVTAGVPGYTQLLDDIQDSLGWVDYTTGTPTEPVPAVGQGYFIYNPLTSATNWVNVFTVQ